MAKDWNWKNIKGGDGKKAFSVDYQADKRDKFFVLMSVLMLVYGIANGYLQAQAANESALALADASKEFSKYLAAKEAGFNWEVFIMNAAPGIILSAVFDVLGRFFSKLAIIANASKVAAMNSEITAQLALDSQVADKKL